MKLKPIEQQVVVVVGATSGIGRETALRFADRGAKVVAAGRSTPALETLVQDINRQGGEAVAVTTDTSDFQQVQALANRAVEAYGRIDTWVHAAAVSMYAPFTETTPDEFKRIIEVNLLGQAYGAMAALPHLRAEGRGALIHITSVEGQRSLPLQSAYASSKQGVAGFLDSLRMELEHDKIPISVTNILPSSINTPLFDKALTKLGVKPRPIPPVYEPSVVADAIVYAAEHPEREMVVGGAGQSLGLLQRMSPRMADRALMQLGFQGQKTDIPKSTRAPNNLFNHIDGYDSTKGSFSQEARPISVYTKSRTNPLLRWGLAATLLATGVVLSSRVLRNRSIRRNRFSRVVSRSPVRITTKDEFPWIEFHRTSRARSFPARLMETIR